MSGELCFQTGTIDVCGVSAGEAHLHLQMTEHTLSFKSQVFYAMFIVAYVHMNFMPCLQCFPSLCDFCL